MISSGLTPHWGSFSQDIASDDHRHRVTIRGAQGASDTAYPRILRRGAAGRPGRGLILYFWRLGVCPLLPPNEGLYSEIAREMNETGDYLTPHLNHLRYYEKPPLFDWVHGRLIQVARVKPEGVVRLVSAFSGVGTIFLTMLMGSLLGGKRLGALSGVIVGSITGNDNRAG